MGSPANIKVKLNLSEYLPEIGIYTHHDNTINEKKL
jgi:hypothetical protein